MLSLQPGSSMSSDRISDTLLQSERSITGEGIYLIDDPTAIYSHLQPLTAIYRHLQPLTRDHLVHHARFVPDVP